MTVRLYGDVRYVDDVTYSTLVKHNINPLEIKAAKLSPLTREIISVTNSTIRSVLFKDRNELAIAEGYGFENSLTKEELTYAKSKVNSYLKSKEGCHREIQKCYDIIPLIHNNDLVLFVVVKEGFLTAVTETKEALLEHFLTLLRHFYDNNASDWVVRQEYLDQRLNKGAFDLVKLRFDRN